MWDINKIMFYKRIIWANKWVLKNSSQTSIKNSANIQPQSLSLQGYVNKWDSFNHLNLSWICKKQAINWYNRIKTQHSFGIGSRETIFIVASPDDSVDVYHDNGEELLKIFDLLFHLLHHSLQIVQPLVGQHYTPIVIWHVFKGIGISWILQLQTNFWMVVAVIVKEMMIIMIIKMENNKLRG